MKDVRNTIAHEYIEDELVEVFDEVLVYTDTLMRIIHNTLHYIQVSYIDAKN
ncbi:MAG: capsule biosynthesis protein [Epsilonproteobacteria bacterium]|nr:capsule biosynthesis protein [Campylobacterota bacterium]PIP09291.1 MAG: capsule biosynthesis protein [Sulfurimonas sp. CG23_combo_of_CG06-09_8_20_14_all_36_33]PIS25765.1 MAG: capsule biosynthesis protein [Sulfurimonas sp. CG08_land_8_20_14_0_20_36_33]PIU34613.1 MAG: capsule biosynthesis protein [Sulfurimonas sp. CG07_land_8_20_14_0_80_36_56]PIV04822.1 MAG: capsule biosynthesis protein [Sulfurimonas sp. CG03_land_8_20_14_0_80_36_25]PIV36303.1 MAG: capsule biosynthesis protein [Sulfurimonas 